jgi:hypothetical protein
MDSTAAVILTVSGTGLSHGDLETVTVNGVVGSPGGIAMTTPRGVTFVAGVLSVAEIRAPDPDSLGTGRCVDRSRFAGFGSASGTRVTVHGIATAGSGTHCYLQDESGGSRSGISVWFPPSPLVPGHRYLLAGTIDAFFGRSELSDLIYLRDEGIGTLPSPMKSPVSVLLDRTCDYSNSLLTSDDLEGALVSIDSVLVTAVLDSSGDFHVAGPYGVFADTIEVENDSTYNFVPSPGQLLNVTGVLAFNSGGFEVHPRNETDITVVGSVVGVGPVPRVSGAVLWLTIAPDPSRGSCAVDFMVPRPALTRLAIYDVAGRLVKTLVNARMVAGPHTIRWEGTDDSGTRVPSGTYFARISAGGETRTKTIVSLR